MRRFTLTLEMGVNTRPQYSNNVFHFVEYITNDTSLISPSLYIPNQLQHDRAETDMTAVLYTECLKIYQSLSFNISHEVISTIIKVRLSRNF